MTKAQLDKVNEIEKRRKYHEEQIVYFDNAIEAVQKDFGSNNNYFLGGTNFSNKTIRRSAAIGFLQTERQYHYQEKKKAENDFKRVSIWNLEA